MIKRKSFGSKYFNVPRKTSAAEENLAGHIIIIIMRMADVGTAKISYNFQVGNSNNNMNHYKA
jgi:hypothetical protein